MGKNTITVYLLLLAQLITGFHLNAAEKPNVILIMSDDQGWGQVGYMDHPHLKGKTPHFFRMRIQ